MSDGRVVRFPSLGQEALYKRIAAHVRELIESRELQPGERLPPERELARMLGVSRIPVREAMRTLAAQGLIEIRHGQGTFVAPRGVEVAVQELAGALLQQRHTFEELFAVRRLLEPASAQWAATRAGQVELERLQRALEAMEEACAADPPDYETIGEHDAQLHLHVAAGTANRVLLRIMQAIQDLHEQQLETSLRYRGRLDRTLADHRRIVAAIVAGDPVEAGSAMLDHLEQGESAALAGIDGLDGSREVR
jgi:GntR family transcriptional regulator, transcriptional repressor for pyruvate dehydrogenase complex